VSITPDCAHLLIAANLLCDESLPRRAKPILPVSMLAFGVMSFGQDVGGNTDGVGSPFTYLGGAAVVYALVRLVPPLRRSAA
jgi:hypothetical protein